MKDTYRHKGLRKKLVSNLMHKGINNNKILEAFMDIPRHCFIEEAFADWAYKDVPFKIDADQTISQPYTVAFMTDLLDVKKGDRILEIGTGSGFQACVLAYLGAKVYSIERQEKLFHKTERLLKEIGYDQIRLKYGDGYQGWERFAPFDKIIITAGAPEIPVKLIHQLKIGGMLVVPLDNETGDQTMIRIIKVEEDKIKRSTHGTFRFVPMLPGTNR